MSELNPSDAAHQPHHIVDGDVLAYDPRIMRSPKQGTTGITQAVPTPLLSLLLRLQTVELTNGNQYELPITQTEFGDTLSLSLVHVTRVLQCLRKNELITLADGRLVILDTGRLKASSSSNPNDLHLSNRNGTAPHSL